MSRSPTRSKASADPRRPRVGRGQSLVPVMAMRLALPDTGGTSLGGGQRAGRGCWRASAVFLFVDGLGVECVDDSLQVRGDLPVVVVALAGEGR